MLLHLQATRTAHGEPRSSDLSIERRRRNHFTTAPEISKFYDFILFLIILFFCLFEAFTDTEVKKMKSGRASTEEETPELKEAFRKARVQRPDDHRLNHLDDKPIDCEYTTNSLCCQCCLLLFQL